MWPHLMFLDFPYIQLLPASPAEAAAAAVEVVVDIVVVAGVVGVLVIVVVALIDRPRPATRSVLPATVQPA